MLGKGRGLAGFAALVGGFSKLNLSPGMIGKFVPIISQYVESKGGKDLVDFVTKALRK